MRPLNQGSAPGQTPTQITSAHPAVVQMANGQQFPAGLVHNVSPAQNPRAGHIQDDWNQSVAQLNDELRQVRDAMADLLKEIRSLIQDYNLQNQLTQVSSAVDTCLNAVGEAYRGTDGVTQAMRVIDTTGWPEGAVQALNRSMNTFNQRLAQARLPVATNPPMPVQRVGHSVQPGPSLLPLDDGQDSEVANPTEASSSVYVSRSNSSFDNSEFSSSAKSTGGSTTHEGSNASHVNKSFDGTHSTDTDDD